MQGWAPAADAQDRLALATSAAGRGGQPLELHGLRPWLGLPVVDAIRIRMDTDALGVRVTSNGDMLWHRDGDLVTVVECLLELPPPWDPRAPRLVIGHAPERRPGGLPRTIYWLPSTGAQGDQVA